MSIGSQRYPLLGVVIFNRRWRELSHYTIAEAALLTMELDPKIHMDRCDFDDSYWKDFSTRRDGEERYLELVAALTSAVEAKEITVVKPCELGNGDIDPSRAGLLKADLLKWWNKYGYRDVADALAPEEELATIKDIKEKAQPESSAPTPLTEDPVADSVTNHNDRHAIARQLRGCKRHIVEHWADICEEYGPSADGRQVQLTLKKLIDPSEFKSLKTIQNCLIELRKEKLIS